MMGILYNISLIVSFLLIVNIFVNYNCIMFQMPTSSQALILLSSDGRLVQSPRRTFPQTTNAYPTRTHDINATCVDVDGNELEAVGDIVVPRQNKIKFDDLISTLPEILQVKGYRGSLSMDVNAKVMRWKIDTDVSPSQMDEFLTYRDESGVHNDYNRGQMRFRLPSIDHVTEVIPVHEYDNYCRVTRIPTATSKDTPRQSVSLPSVFKTTVTEEEYKRLCELGFRHKEKPNNKQPRKRSKVTFKSQEPIDAWASPRTRNDVIHDNKHDNDIEVGTETTHSLTLSHLPDEYANMPHGTHMQQYLVERNEFFAKYGKYETLQRYPNIVPDEIHMSKTNSMKLPDISDGAKAIYANVIDSR